VGVEQEKEDRRRVKELLMLNEDIENNKGNANIGN
jgi:hypothetical protein